jgi:hypothetical protein
LHDVVDEAVVIIDDQHSLQTHPSSLPTLVQGCTMPLH